MGGDGNVVQCSYLGVATDGTTARGNDQGVLIEASSGNRIGGSFPPQRNVISGNLSDGVQILGETSEDNRVQGNRIGTNAAGTAAVPNGGSGVAVDGAPGNLVGVNAAGGTTDEANMISGNRGAGVRIAAGPAQGNVVSGNLIGLSATRQAALGNALSGVSIEQNANGTVVLGNEIAFNGRHGIEVTGLGTGNALRANLVFSNAGLGIDLGGDGPTPNDPGDADVGPNTLQNAPILTSAVTDGTVTRIRGAFQTTPLTPLTVDVLINAACDPSGRGEGETGAIGLSGATNADGFFFIDTTMPPLAAGTILTALATTSPQAAQPNNTSEYSACVRVVSGVPPDGFNKVWVGGTPTNEIGWTRDDNWSPPGRPRAADDVYIQPTEFQPEVNTPAAVTRNLALATGATLDLAGNTLTSVGDVDASRHHDRPGHAADGAAQPGHARRNGPGSPDRGRRAACCRRVLRAGQPRGGFGGVFDPLGEVVVIGGGLSTTGTGILRMTSNALVHVGGDARFTGGSTEDQFTAGTLRVSGNFTQSNVDEPGVLLGLGHPPHDPGGPGHDGHLRQPRRRARNLALQRPAPRHSGRGHVAERRLRHRAADHHRPDPSDRAGTGAPPGRLGPQRLPADRGLRPARVRGRRADAVRRRHLPETRRERPDAPRPPRHRTGLHDAERGLRPAGGAEGLLVANDSTPVDEFRFQLVLTGASPPNGCPFTFGDALVTWNGTPCQ